MCIIGSLRTLFELIITLR